VRNAFAETLYDIAKDDPDVFIVVADISPGAALAKFQSEFGERFINVGVSEQAMIGVCAGLALRGCKPFAYTIATFAIYRPFEMVRDDLCYQNLPVTVVGVGGGVNYSFLGGTHHAQEDVAVMSAIPNMTVVAPCDPREAAAATRAVMDVAGPVYLRLGKAGEPVLTDAAEPFELGKVRYLERGTDTCILTYGPITKLACSLADRIRSDGRSVSVVSVHTLKPLDVDGVERALHDHEEVVVIEEHAPTGGLAERVKAIAWDTKAPCRLRTHSLKDEFIHLYGPHETLLAAHGLELETIAAASGQPA
jgi:transketolase